jgi:hypothetical protein
LKRNLTPSLPDAAFGWRKSVKPLLEKGSFASFTHWIDHDVANTGAVSGQHGAGHNGIGGEVRRFFFLNVSKSN